MAGVVALGPRGKRLWRDLLKRDPRLADQQNPDRAVALEACRVADQIEQLQAILDEHGSLTDEDRAGAVRMHPAFVAQQAARPLLARLIVALRMPDQQTGEVPQRRGIRGVQKPSRSRVASLEDRLRRASGGVAAG